jgi:hypothetical protein
MSLDGSEAFFYSSLTNTQGVDAQYINLNGQTGILKGVNDTIEGSSTTDDLPEGKTNLYFTNARVQGAFTGGAGIVITSGTISNTGVLSLTGTAGRVSVSGATGNITLSGPQDIDTGSTPSFEGLTLTGTGTLTARKASLSGAIPLNFPSGNFTNSLLYCDASVSGEIHPLNISANLRITGSGGLYILDTKQNLQTTSTPTFAGLTLGTLSGVLKATTGTIAGSATTDDLTEGKTNLYFTNARAQGALTAGTGISITSGTIANTGITAITAGTNITTSNTGGSYTINTTTNPTFNNLTITSMSSNVPDGVALGTNAGASGRYNAYIGTQAGTGSVGSGNVGIGYQALAGAGSGCFGLGFTAGYQALTNGNIAIGGSAGQNLLTGSGYNIYIGGSPSSSSASYETVIGASASAPVGKGDNTCYIPNSGGLYYYSPATCFLYATNFSNGRCQWANYASNNPIKGFTLSNYGNGANTVIVPNIPGLYQIDVSGTVLGSGGSIFGTWNNVNIRNYTHFLQSFSSLGIAYQVGFSVQSRPYSVVSASGFELQFSGATYYGGLPVFVSIRFISL